MNGFPEDVQGMVDVGIRVGGGGCDAGVGQQVDTVSQSGFLEGGNDGFRDAVQCSSIIRYKILPL